MKKILLLSFVLLFFLSECLADVISGKVRQDDKLYAQNQVIDAQNGKPVDNARVTVPRNGYETYSDKDGRFELNTKIETQQFYLLKKKGFVRIL